MEKDSMSNFYYVRTAEGQTAAYDVSSAMPRKLRSLLKVIDGNTSNEVFANSLKAFGDVAGLLSSLEKAGLIELRQSSAEASAAPSPTAQLKKLSANQKPKHAEHADGFAPTQSIHTPSSSTLNATYNSQTSPARQLQEQQELQVLVQDMSSFVLAYVPEQAFGVLSELEQITAMEQMAVLLGGYELIVNHVGEPAHIHLMHVRQVLGRWL